MLKSLDLTGRVAVVVGGTSGIGAAIAGGLAEAGAHVVPSGRRAEQIDAICALPGLRALMIGPFDLSVALDCEGDCNHPDAIAAIGRMVAAARANSVPVIMPIFAPDLAETQRQIAYWRSEGVRMFTIGTDKILLYSQCAQFVVGLRMLRADSKLRGSDRRRPGTK